MARLKTLTANMAAFLDMIAFSELGPKLLADPATDDGYRILVGATPVHPLIFPSYARHPRIRNAALNSDAAGRYQFMGRYWETYRDQLHLQDFGPESQDRWCLALIGECRATTTIEAGRVNEGLRLCKSRWASLPGAGYGQRENRINDLVAAYRAAGGDVK